MNSGLILVAVLWLVLLFAIPAGIYAIFKETRDRTCCTSLVISMSIVQIIFVGAFVMFTLLLFPYARALFL